MREAVIVATARTPITKANRGEFNSVAGPTLASFAVRAVLDRSGVDPDLFEDVILGCGYPEGTVGRNVARQTAIRSGLPVHVAGATVSRFCASGLQAIAMGASRIVVDGATAVIAGGLEICSQIRSRSATDSGSSGVDPWIADHKPQLYLPMIETGDIVARRYGISREAQDRFALRSQERTARAQASGVFSEEVVSCTTDMVRRDKETGRDEVVTATVDHDMCNRPSTTYDALAKLAAVMGPEGFVTAGNASQLSDGASACVLMEARTAERLGLEPLGSLRGFTVVGCEPDEMGVGPARAVPHLLSLHHLQVDDIGLWELNEAFASQALYCQEEIGIPSEILNVNGGAISIGHPFGMTGARMAGHALLEGRRRHVKYAVATMCVGGGMGAAGLFEIYS